MSYCFQCAKVQTVNAGVCNSCGATVSAFDSSAQEIEPVWQHRFALIEKAGGAKMPNLDVMPIDERYKIKFNFLAFLFGPLYYLIKGMWKKAITLWLLISIILMPCQMVLLMLGWPELVVMLLAGFFASWFFASRANRDYYKKIVLSQNGWW